MGLVELLNKLRCMFQICLGFPSIFFLGISNPLDQIFKLGSTEPGIKDLFLGRLDSITKEEQLRDRTTGVDENTETSFALYSSSGSVKQTTTVDAICLPNRGGGDKITTTANSDKHLPVYHKDEFPIKKIRNAKSAIPWIERAIHGITKSEGQTSESRLYNSALPPDYVSQDPEFMPTDSISKIYTRHIHTGSNMTTHLVSLCQGT